MTDQVRVAVITGAAQGIGRATALRFARDGYSVAALDLQHEAAERVVGEVRALGVDGAAFAVDVGDSAAVNATIEQVVSTLGRLDVLVNNAGTHVPGEVAELSDESYHRTVSTILHGTFYCSRAVLPTMISQQSGSIVNVSSVWAWACAGGAAPYCMAKAGVVALTKSLAAEVGKHGIRVNGVGPYLVNTELHRSSHTQESRDAMAAGSPMGRECQPEEVAACIAFLAGADASWVSGETMAVSGASFLR